MKPETHYLVKLVRARRREANRSGQRPTFVCLGQLQQMVLDNEDDVCVALNPTHICGLRIVWVGNHDLIAVYEERAFCGIGTAEEAVK